MFLAVPCMLEEPPKRASHGIFFLEYTPGQTGAQGRPPPSPVETGHKHLCEGCFWPRMGWGWSWAPHLEVCLWQPQQWNTVLTVWDLCVCVCVWKEIRQWTGNWREVRLGQIFFEDQIITIWVNADDNIQRKGVEIDSGEFTGTKPLGAWYRINPEHKWLYDLREGER